MKDQHVGPALTTARKLAMAEIFASYIHEQSNMISTLSAMVSHLFFEMKAPRQFKSLETSIVDVIDKLHEHNRLVQRFLLTELDKVEHLQDVIESIRQLFQEQAARKKIHLKVNMDSGIAHIEVFSSLQTVLSNLMANALEATPPRGRIILEAGLHEDALKISVTDTGPGIPASLGDKIWEPFSTTSSDRAGLGLSICRAWAEKVGASIAIDSSHAAGARFTIKIPFERLHHASDLD